MSLTIKKKSNFKPKAAPRRPGGASTQTSARPSVERQSQTPNPSIPTEITSVPGRTQDEEVPREISIAEYTPQPTSSEPISQQTRENTNPPDQDASTQLRTRGDQHHPPDHSPSENDTANQTNILPSEIPTQTLLDVVRVEGSEASAQQTASLKRKGASNADSVSNSLAL